MEKYLNAAEQVAEQAIVLNPDRTLKIPVGEMVMTSGVSSQNGESLFFSSGTASTVANLPKPGLYKLKMTAYGDQAGTEPPMMAVNLEGKPETIFEVRSVKGKPTDFEIPFSGSAGPNKISVAFRNDYYNPKDPAGKQDRNLILASMQIVGPLSGDVGLPESHTRIMISKPEVGKERVARSRFSPRSRLEPTADRSPTKKSTDCSISLTSAKKGMIRSKRAFNTACKPFWSPRRSFSASKPTQIPPAKPPARSVDTSSHPASATSSGARCRMTG
jgi:hypothetical protein